MSSGGEAGPRALSEAVEVAPPFSTRPVRRFDDLITDDDAHDGGFCSVFLSKAAVLHGKVCCAIIAVQTASIYVDGKEYIDRIRPVVPRGIEPFGNWSRILVVRRDHSVIDVDHVHAHRAHQRKVA